MGSITKALFGGSDSRSSQQSNSQLDPRLFNLFNNNFNRTTGVANNLGVRQFAGFSPDQLAGMAGIRNTVNGPGIQNANAAASNVAGMASTVPQSIASGDYLRTNFNTFLNPYLDVVAGNTMSNLDRMRQNALTSGQAQATMTPGAFGGSRHGVSDALTNSEFFRQAGTTLGDLYNSGYNNAQQMAYNSALQGANLGMSMNQMLAALGQQQQQMGLQGNEAMMNVGAQQQNLDQQRLDANRNIALERNQLINEALGINPGGGSGMVSNSSGSSSSSSSNGMVQGIGTAIGAVLAASDRNVKENISKIDSPLDKLAKLSGYEYNYKDSPARTAGVMAQDVEKVMPSAVHHTADGTKMVNYTEVTGLLVDAVNELAKQRKRG